MDGAGWAADAKTGKILALMMALAGWERPPEQKTLKLN